jgi:hypothetical protein
MQPISAAVIEKNKEDVGQWNLLTGELEYLLSGPVIEGAIFAGWCRSQ